MLNPPRIPTRLRIVRTCVPSNSTAVMPDNVADRNICESEVGCKVDLSCEVVIADLVPVSDGIDDRQDSFSVSEFSQENNDLILDIRVGALKKPIESSRLLERAMGIEPTSDLLQPTEYTGFPSLVRVQLRPTLGNLKRPS